MSVLASVTNLSDSEPELGNEKSEKTETMPKAPAQMESKAKASAKTKAQAKKETKPKAQAKKETKPKASAKTKASATKKRPAAADPETSEIPTVVTAETENAYCNANEGDGGFRLRPYKQTKAMAIQRTTGQKNQVLQAGFYKSSAWFILHEKKIF